MKQRFASEIKIQSLYISANISNILYFKYGIIIEAVCRYDKIPQHTAYP